MAEELLLDPDRRNAETETSDPDRRNAETETAEPEAVEIHIPNFWNAYGRLLITYFVYPAVICLLFYLSNSQPRVLEQKQPPVRPSSKGKIDENFDWMRGPAKGYTFFTDSEIEYKDGGVPYLVIIGHVFDVTSGFHMYKPGTGYHGFIGKDASRAFVSGDFGPEGLSSDVSGLKAEDYAGLVNWLKFYLKSYKFVGYHIGRYFDESKRATEELGKFREWVHQADLVRKEEGDMKKAYPPCNVEWTDKAGTTFWCSKMSGGISRDWEGHPYQFKELPDKPPRCACIQSETISDPRMSPYPGCEGKITRCKLGNGKSA